MADNLTAAQQENLQMFQEVTQVLDRPRAIQYLQMSNWNLEQAINLQMTGALDNNPGGAGGGAGAGGMTGIVPGDVSAVTSGGRGLSNRGDQQGGMVGQVLEKAVSVAGRIFGAVGGFLYNLIIPDETPASQRQNFKLAYERQFGTTHPVFFEGTFNQAINKAKEDVRLLCIYYHCETASLADSFCKDVLQNDFIISLLNEQYILWAGDITHKAVYDLARTCGVRQYPYLALILPLSTTNYQILHKVDGRAATNVDGLVALLTQGLDDLAQRRHELSANVEARYLREEQDRELQESLAKDREAERQRNIEEEARKKAQEEERQVQLAREKEINEIEGRRKQLATKLVSIPEGDDRPKTKIQVKMPQGQKLNRTFLQEHTVKDLFDWVESAKYAEPDQPKIPLKFSLKTSFPSKTLSRDTAETLKEAGLTPNAAVLMQDNDEDDF